MKPVHIAVFLLMALTGCSQWTRYQPETATPESVALRSVLPATARRTEFLSGYDAIATRNYGAAEPLLARHLNDRPDDPYALLAMGAVMEQTNRAPDAAMYYRLAARYGTDAPLGMTNGVDDTVAGDARTISDLALYNLTRLPAP